ncbi:OsmC family protein [Virgibacillus xinjiangensis]|uniref:OsmC family protein n=1 Tax=Virgibacillus xinjiangensis TaxID=393090 RepID=A0ABV7CS16_9BACI
MEFHMKECGIQTDLQFGELCVSGNEEHGYRPFQLMVASIAGCSGSVLRKILEKQRADIEDIQIVADTIRNPADANRIEEISLNFTVKGRDLDPAKMQKNLETARNNCSMIRSVEDSIRIVESIEIEEMDG